MRVIAEADSYVEFRQWTGDRELATIGTNAQGRRMAY
jgi:hypothetical protein